MKKTRRPRYSFGGNTGNTGNTNKIPSSNVPTYVAQGYEVHNTLPENSNQQYLTVDLDNPDDPTQYYLIPQKGHPNFRPDTGVDYIPTTGDGNLNAPAYTKKFAFGSTSVGNNSQVKNYIEQPNDALAKNQEAIAQAMYEASSDPLYVGMKALGGLGMGVAGQMGGTGSAVADGAMSMFSSLEFAMGGIAGGEQIEVEGKEVIETPNGKVKEVKGPSHENGGVDVTVPTGSSIFSDRIKVEGETMAMRKKARAAKLEKLDKKLKESPTDKIAKTTYARTKSALDKEEQMDMQLQELIGGILGGSGGPQQKAAFGMNVGYDPNDPNLDAILGDEQGMYNPDGSLVNQKPTLQAAPIMQNFAGKSTTVADKDGNDVAFGDILTVGGGLFSSFAPYLNTLRNRAGDTANVNAYKDFGKDALDANQNAQGYVEGQKQDALQDLTLSKRTAQVNARKGSRSINTMRALNLGSEQEANKSMQDIYGQYSQQMMQLLGQQSGLENQQDQAVMQGEEKRDTADRMDKDAFNTALAKNLGTIGQGLQETGKSLNAGAENEVTMNMLNQLSTYFDMDAKGNLIPKKQ